MFEVKRKNVHRLVEMTSVQSEHTFTALSRQREKCLSEVCLHTFVNISVHFTRAVRKFSVCTAVKPPSTTDTPSQVHAGPHTALSH